MSRIETVALLPAFVCAALAASCWMEDDDMGMGDGDGLGCTEIGCEDMLTVRIERSDGLPFPGGVYVFTFTFEDSPTARTECVLDGSDLDCGGDLADLMVEIDDSSKRFTAMYFGAPGHATVRLTRGDEVLGERTYHPSYDFVSPNGPECPPTCSQATQDMDVVAPGEA